MLLIRHCYCKSSYTRRHCMRCCRNRCGGHWHCRHCRNCCGYRWYYRHYRRCCWHYNIIVKPQSSRYHGYCIVGTIVNVISTVDIIVETVVIVVGIVDVVIEPKLTSFFLIKNHNIVQRLQVQLHSAQPQ